MEQSSTEIEQRSEAWFAARCGKATASCIADIIAKTKSGPSAMRENYKNKLVEERIKGRVEPGYCNAAMQHGIDTEPTARAAYAFHEGVELVEIGFVDHPTIAWSGASPDGLVGDDGLIEIKCPQFAAHMATLKTGKIPAKYIAQMQWQMACTGRAWCDFASFNPDFPEERKLFVKRVHRDDAMIRELETEVAAFLEEVAAEVAWLNSPTTTELKEAA